MAEIKIISKEKQMPRLVKVAAYARVSSDKDAMLHSLSSQVSYFSKMIQSHDSWKYVGVYSDEGMTGTKSNRQGFIKMIEDAKALEAAGAFACVLECVPAKLAAKVTAELKNMATIGIGAGNGCDGQVLVCNDLLGVSNGFCPKFVKKYANLHDITVEAVKSYIAECKDRSFPAEEHTFKIDDSVLEKLY